MIGSGTLHGGIRWAALGVGVGLIYDKAVRYGALCGFMTGTQYKPRGPHLLTPPYTPCTHPLPSHTSMAPTTCASLPAHRRLPPPLHVHHRLGTPPRPLPRPPPRLNRCPRPRRPRR